jgi:branched-chain amino acid transport system ATP-binding protein
MSAASLRVTGIRKRFGGVVAVDDASLAIAPGELHALIGPNGAGKTTLIQLLSGAARADSGTIEIDGVEVSTLSMHRRVRLGLARSYQISSLFPAFTAQENVALAIQARHGSSFAVWRPVVERTEWFDPARQTLDAVGLGARAETIAADLAHGERRLLELAVALATGARLLLLDEPMAGLGPEESGRFIALLGTLKRRVTILLVEHDMDAVFRLADRISTLVYGRVIASGTPDEIRADPEVRRAYLGENVRP